MKSTKKIDYKCTFCKHEWALNYPMSATPKIELQCPECKKIGKFQKPFNFFRESQKSKEY